MTIYVLRASADGKFVAAFAELISAELYISSRPWDYEVDLCRIDAPVDAVYLAETLPPGDHGGWAAPAAPEARNN